MSAKRIGAFVCHCGGNISDYVDVERVRAAAEREPGVAVAKTFLFACSDAAQQEMAQIVKDQGLDGIVIASCSPKLHLATFRAMAQRAGLNPYMYTQCNVREQCSWAHRHAREPATAKATDLVRAGIAKTRLGVPLTRAAGRDDPGGAGDRGGRGGDARGAGARRTWASPVYLVERAAEVGGRVPAWGRLFPNDRDGAEIVATLLGAVRGRENITLFTGAEVVEKSGSVGDFTVKVRVGGTEQIALRVGAIVVATGFDPYAPEPGEFGYGLPGVVTLPEFRELLAGSQGALRVQGRAVKTIAYVYCVGSRQAESEACPHPNRYCSRFCCNAAVHTALLANAADGSVNQYHLYRDMRTYGKNELLFEDAGRKGSVFVRWSDDDAARWWSGRATGSVVRVKDNLLAGEDDRDPGRPGGPRHGDGPAREREP